MLIKLQKKMDNLMTAISAILIAAMFLVIIVNVILRLIPAIGGFKWYMEFSQYANVWAMLLGAVGIAVMGTNLRVEAVDALILSKIPGGLKIGRLIVDIAELIFYFTMTYSGCFWPPRQNRRFPQCRSLPWGRFISFSPLQVRCVFWQF